MKALDRGQTPYVATPDTTDEVGFVQVDADGVARDARSTFAGIAGAVAATVAVDPSLSSRYAPVANVVGQAGIRWAFFGDSITNGSTASNFAYSYMPQALQMVGSLVGRYDSIESGNPSEASAAISARMQAVYDTYTDVHGTVLMAGTNDASTSVPVATYAATMTAAIARARKYGPVVVCTVPAAGAGASAAVVSLIDSYNWWIKTFAPGLGAVVADTWSAIVDTTTGTMLSTYNSGDDVHPNNDGHREMAQVVAKAMQTAAGRTVPYGLLTSKMASTKLHTSDPLVVGGTTKPASWFEQPGGTGTAPTYSLVSDTSGFLPAGRWSQIDFDATSGGTRNHAVGLAAGGANGDLLAVCAHIQIEDVSGTWEADCSAGTAGISAIVTNGGAAITGGSPIGRCAGVPTATAGIYNIGPIFWPVTAPTTSSNLALWVQMTLPTGKRVKFRVGCIGVVNLTNMGVAGQFAWGNAPVAA